MTDYVALLRGVNVGSGKRLPMADVRTMLTEIGFHNVATYIQSGNAVFTSDLANNDVRCAIEERLAGYMGRSVSVLVSTQDDLQAIVDENPFPDATADGAKLFITLLDGKLHRAVIEAAEASDWSPDRLAFTKRAAYAACPNGLSKSTLWKFDWQALADGAVTTRNWNTITKLLDMLPN